MSNIPARVLGLAAQRGQALAYQMQREKGGYRQVNWAEYHDRTLRLASYLKSRGVRAGDKVVLLSENCPEWSMAALAVMSLEATLVPIASIASASEIENIIRASGANLCIFSNKAPNVKSVDSNLLRDFLYWDSSDNNPIQEICQQWEPLEIDLEKINPKNTALLIFTSGTTGSPKAVPLTHENVIANAEDVISAISASERDRCVSVLPLSHMLEFTGGFLVAALVGASVTYIKGLRAEDLLRAMKETKATILIAVPLLFEVMARNLEAKLNGLPAWLRAIFQQFTFLVKKNRALGPILFFPIHRALGGNIRFFMAGGSRLQPAVYELFRGFGIPVLQGYGLTETSPVLSVTTLKTRGPDHVGTALPSVQIGIFSEAGEPMSMGSEGEVWAKGPNVFKGYLDQSHNKDVFSGDWFKTGDLGTLEKDGFLRITGRKKDIIVTGGGKNVYPEEIESLVLATGCFLECAIFGLQGEDGHEKVALAIVPDRAKIAKNFGATNTEDVLASARKIALDACKSLSDYKWPQRTEVFFEELPKTITRKVKKHEVRALVKKRDIERGKQDKNVGLDPADGAVFLRMDDELEKSLATQIASVTRLSVQEILRSASLSRDLNLDSLLIVEVVGGVEKRFEHRFDGADFSKLDTVGDLLSILGRSLGEKRKKKYWDRVWLAEFKPFDNFRKRWRWPRTLINRFLRFWLKGYYLLEVEGLENLKPGESFVITPNHCSHFDTLAVMSALPESMVHTTFAVAAKDYFFNKAWKAFLARILINAIPFDRKARVDEGMSKCSEILAQHGSLLIFPEGTRSPDGKIQEFKAGVGQLLAAQKRIKAVPTYIEGAHFILPKGRAIPHFRGRLKIRFGKPVGFPEQPPTKEAFKYIAKTLQVEVDKLKQAIH